MTAQRRVRPLGDTALLLDADSVEDAHRLAEAVQRAALSGVEDIVVGFKAVTVIAEPTALDMAALSAELAGIAVLERQRRPGRLVEIAVTFDGVDLEDVARLCAVCAADVVDLLCDAELLVAFLGFAPGFAYLVGLPDVLADMARRSTPRPSVPAGSVALGGGFAGIYPQSSPGGWHLVGHSGVRLFDAELSPFSLLQPGDRVRLVPSEAQSRNDMAPTRPRLASSSPRTIVMQSPGMLTLVEDLGRRGTQHLGVPRSGGADPFSLRTANRLVGNDDGDAALEVTGSGPSIVFRTDANIAVVGGAGTAIDGVSLPAGAVAPVAAGQVLSIGPVRHGCRAYLAIDGGIDIPPVLGSRSSDVLAHLGPGPLVAGDVLALGPRRRAHGQVRDAAAIPGAPARLRVVLGPDDCDPDALHRLVTTPWAVSADSDRVGVRLSADNALHCGPGPSASRGMVTGAVQVPPDGQPIVLLCDHATVGGYPVVAAVISADMGVLGQLRPGDLVQFDPVDLAEAARARSVRERAINGSIVGWYPVRSD